MQYKMCSKTITVITMQTDIHVELVSPYHCYTCSRHTWKYFLLWITVSNEDKRNVNNILRYTVIFGVLKEFLHTFVIAVSYFNFRLWCSQKFISLCWVYSKCVKLV